MAVKEFNLCYAETRIYHAFAISVDPDQLASESVLHCLPLSMWIWSINADHVIWLAEN